MQDCYEKNKKEIGNKLDDFIILSLLGKSNYGFVSKVQSKKNGKIYAMKKSDLSIANKKNILKYYKNHPLFLKQLDHENICKYYTDFQEGDNLYIIMEYMDGGNLMNLLKLIKKFGTNEERLIKIFLKCLQGLEYIHSKGIIHRDIKLANIVMDNEDQVKIIDFKMAAFSNFDKAKFLPKDNNSKRELINHNTIIGSEEYKAPEIAKDPNIKIKYDDKIDVYSMGIIFCALAYQRLSLPKKDEKTPYSKELYDIIKKMIINEPSYRPKSSEILENLKSFYSNEYLYNSGIYSCLKCLCSFPVTSQLLLYDKKQLENNPLCTNTIDCMKKLNDNLSTQKEINLSLYNFRDFFIKKVSKSIPKIFSYKNNEIQPFYILKNLLIEINKELNINIQKDKKVKQGFHFTREDKDEAYDCFMDYYDVYFKSIISDTFFGLLKTKNICKECRKEEYSFKNFYIIHFNIKNIEQFCQNEKNELTLYNAFNYQNKNCINLNVKDKIICKKCKKYTPHVKYTQFFETAENLIIFFDRGENCKYKNFLNFEEKLKLNGNNVESFKKYENGLDYQLLSVLCRIQEYDEKQKNKRKEKYICFIRAKNNKEKGEKETLYLNCYNKTECNLHEIKNTGDVICLFYYCEDITVINNQSININNNQNMNNNNNQALNNNNLIMNNNQDLNNNLIMKNNFVQALNMNNNQDLNNNNYNNLVMNMNYSQPLIINNNQGMNINDKNLVMNMNYSQQKMDNRQVFYNNNNLVMNNINNQGMNLNNNLGMNINNNNQIMNMNYNQDLNMNNNQEMNINNNNLVMNNGNNQVMYMNNNQGMNINNNNLVMNNGNNQVMYMNNNQGMNINNNNLVMNMNYNADINNNQEINLNDNNTFMNNNQTMNNNNNAALNNNNLIMNNNFIPYMNMNNNQDLNNNHLFMNNNSNQIMNINNNQGMNINNNNPNMNFNNYQDKNFNNIQAMNNNICNNNQVNNNMNNGNFNNNNIYNNNNNMNMNFDN